MKYRELPIDDSKGVDQFKVGDRVNVYLQCHTHPFRSEVTDVNSDFLLRVKGHDNALNWKQCRKLEEVKPREWWVNRNDLGLFNESAAIVYEPNANMDPKYWIKVREVLEDE